MSNEEKAAPPRHIALMAMAILTTLREASPRDEIDLDAVRAVCNHLAPRPSPGPIDPDLNAAPLLTRLDIDAAWHHRRGNATIARDIEEAIEVIGTLQAVAVQACRDGDRSMLATPAGAELVAKAVEALDASGAPKIEPTFFEVQCIRVLNNVKAWRDSEGNEPFPQEAREMIDALLMTAEQRRIGVRS
jgi:hypothetical protein